MLYLQSSEQKLLCEILEDLTSSEAFTGCAKLDLATKISSLLNADFFASYLWNPGKSSFVQGVGVNIPDQHLLDYENYYQQIDPISSALKTATSAVSVNDALDQKELLKTEFFNDFLSRDGMYWGMNLYVFDRDGINLSDMRIWRCADRGPFTQKEIDILNIISPVFRHSMLSHTSEIDVSLSIDSIMKQTGLTNREAEICIEIALGSMDEAIADKLNISFHTVRSHLRNIFMKLHVNNRTQLISVILSLGKKTAN